MFFVFGPVFGQSWAQECAQRPRLEKRYINQRYWTREIDYKVENLALCPSQFWELLFYGLAPPGRKIGLPSRIWAGFFSEKHKNRPSGRPKAGRRPDSEALPTRIRPASSPEARFPVRKHYCENYGSTIVLHVNYWNLKLTTGMST